jgi:hypothetical protein
LWCHNNNLTTLNVSGLANLKELWCYYNNLTTLNVSGLLNLLSLSCRYNFLPNETAVEGFTGVWDNWNFRFSPQKEENETTIVRKDNWGANGNASLKSVTAVANGSVSVGYMTIDPLWGGKGGSDAIIIKQLALGSYGFGLFGGSGDDSFNSVIAVADGAVAVGYSDFSSFGNGDWNGVAGKGVQDAIIVKYDNNGEILWKKNFGGNGYDTYLSVTELSDGSIIAVGYANATSFNSGDWTIGGKGGIDAIIVKYDSNGNRMWCKNFGGSGNDAFNSVTAVADGFIAVGFSSATSFNNNDWIGVTGYGGADAIIVKYDFNGEILWKNHFGGSGEDSYKSVTTVADGIIVVGYSAFASFNGNDWAGVGGKGDDDAIIVKYNFDGTVAWKKNFGGNGYDTFNSITTVTDGLVAVGYSFTFDNGDWFGVTGKGSQDAIIVKYDNNGNVVSKNNFGGEGSDEFCGVATLSDGIVAVGYSGFDSFGNGNWSGYESDGAIDAIIVKYAIPVLNITNVPTQTAIDVPLLLTGTIKPDNATFKTIEWSIKNAGATGAILLNNNILFATATGTVTVTATIAGGGETLIKNYTQDFDIKVTEVGIVETENYPSVQFYPNPTKGELRIEMGDMGYGICDIEIFDVMGRCVGIVETGRAPSLQSEIVFDISHLANGIYFLRIQTENGIVTKKIIKSEL